MSAARLRRCDLVVPATIGLVGAVEVGVAGYEPVWPTLGSYLLAAAVLCAGRVVPLAVPLIVIVIYASAASVGANVAEPSSWVPLIAVACLGSGLHAPRSRWGAGLVSVLAALVILLGGMIWLTDVEPNVLFGLFITVGGWGLGLALREALEQHRRAGADAERARLGRALAGRRAAEAERERIAAELHDVLAHSLGTMVVQSAVAGDLSSSDPAAARAALSGVARAGREALAETGRLLRLLRDEQDELGLRGGGVVSADADIPPAARPRVRRVAPRDAVLPGFVGAVATVEILFYGYEPLWASLAGFWLCAGVLCLRRIAPLAMPTAVMGLTIAAHHLVGAETDEPAALVLAGGLAFYSAGRHVPRSQLLSSFATVTAALALMTLDAAARGAMSGDAVLLVTLALGPWAVGIALRETLERTRSLAVEAERARLHNEQEAERAATAERRRIARELHDVLANSLSVMIVQAALAADLVGRDVVGAAAAVAEVQRSGRTALEEIGRLLRLIAAGEELRTRPQHGVADVPALADDFARAGLRIDLDLDGVASLPIGVDLSTYRIVQEGLTNALRHAPGSAVRVRLARADSGVAIEVRNGPAPPAAVPVPGGHGLVGLRERVSLFGGTLEARATSDGGFVLAATIPVVPEAA